MRTLRSVLSLIIALLFIQYFWLQAESVRSGQKKVDGIQVFWLGNDQIHCSVSIEEGILKEDKITPNGVWLSGFGSRAFEVKTDADFALDLMWARWKAPGKANNAENPVLLTKRDFRMVQHIFRKSPGGSVELALYFKREGIPLEVRLTYRLEPHNFFMHRELAVRDVEFGFHFLRRICPRRGFIQGRTTLVKAGGFGQPVAFRQDDGGAFFGLEYPTADNFLQHTTQGNFKLNCGQVIGERIGKPWIKSEWVVQGISPDAQVKQWFWKYLDSVRVAPLTFYLLYNSWYDLRAPVMVKDPSRALSERNVLRTIESFRRRMVVERSLQLDAFVLDDGWDVYGSDWVLNAEQFPEGLAPVSDALQSMGSRLGIWIGPTGGYSHRNQRIAWMKSNGYEVVGDQLCVAGTKYRSLLKERVTDFIRSHGTRYFKWDGIQFSCNEPDHGHPPDIYSRRAVMQSVSELCRTAREADPDVFLNITSGTWLSPWWLKYANTIWMQGSDYGYANVPSISQRDRAMTYRDTVLYDDLVGKRFWFPIANLMTHGIIKGHLQKLGGEAEPLEKFTDNALLYFARGISMGELYISPDLLTDEEWDALAMSVQWAKDRFSILDSTEMVGGNPEERNPYGYAHFEGKRGIIAARNPFMEPKTLKLFLSPALGLDPGAEELVVDKIYPIRYVSPELVRAGAALEFPLEGYETAVYEIYPLEGTKEPLLAGVKFELASATEEGCRIRVLDSLGETRLLNPEQVSSFVYNGKRIDPLDKVVSVVKLLEPVNRISVQKYVGEGQFWSDIRFRLHAPTKEATFCFLLEPSGVFVDGEVPAVVMSMNGEPVGMKTEAQEGRWTWYKCDVPIDSHMVRVQIIPPGNKRNWKGTASAWLVLTLEPEAKDVFFTFKEKLERLRPMPPRHLRPGQFRRTVKLGSFEVSTNAP
ncbi:MAG: alpha-galactosidase [Candidatus Aminicenantes bacterium]